MNSLYIGISEFISITFIEIALHVFDDQPLSFRIRRSRLQ